MSEFTELMYRWSIDPEDESVVDALLVSARRTNRLPSVARTLVEWGEQGLLVFRKVLSKCPELLSRVIPHLHRAKGEDASLWRFYTDRYLWYDTAASSSGVAPSRW